ncbi:hypothetical protein [Caproiciproducens sp. MSJ-32]|uniref:hypothetical protein n=1 Tax=Caproiciproducens sp. MSJ-32 TaxID=2841527 RepID=UPI001C115EEB|nr:hypothetical protein [Caproiciproducens sp. MSJ-32]MBU5455572.1 hypothetical protein [Caproiciproducens sp. MSJ-32]
MVGILSIDFDYFINASSQERYIYFPNGSDEIPSNKLKSMWEERYLKYPELKKVGIIEDFYFLKNFLMKLKIPQENFLKVNSHKYIKNIIDRIPKILQLMIVNIDFHHDYYHYYKGPNNYNCGNWLRRVIEERPNTKVRWIRRRDSQIYSLDGTFPFEHTEDIKSISNENFDYVFLCRSPEWSPIHLNDKFEELASSVKIIC